MDMFSAIEVTDPEQIGVAELRALFDKWTAQGSEMDLRSASAFDAIDHFDTAARWTILDRIDGKNDFTIHFMGSDVVGLTSIEGTGKRLSDLKHEIGPKLLARTLETVNQALDLNKPVFAGPANSAVEGKDWVISTSLTLPLSRSGARADRVLIVSNYDMGD